MAQTTEWLPNEPLFHHVLSAFTANPDHILVHDWVKNTEASCMQLLSDMVHMRGKIVQALPRSRFDSRGRIMQEQPFLLILAPGNYDFIVAAFAALCCGAAFSPISSKLSPEEASYILKLSNAQCILFSPEFEAQVLAILQYETDLNNGQECTVIAIPITGHITPTIPASQIQIDSEMMMDPKSPGTLVFTSGTTGPPKGIVRPRDNFYPRPNMSFPVGGAALNFRPPIWAAVMSPLILRAVQGIKTEVISDDVSKMWERFKTGAITNLLGAPNLWARLMRHFREHLDVLPPQQREQYVRGARGLQHPLVTGNFTWPKVAEFWRELLGRPLINMYACSEVGVMAMTEGLGLPLDRCIGRPLDQVQLKLSDGDHGEILVKTRFMFPEYIGNPEGTAAAFDKDGFYRTGDFGRLVGDQYVLEGRAATDFIRRGGLWISLQEVEDRLVQLAYISEAYVVKANYNCTQQAAAVVRVSTITDSVNLFKIRKNLHDALPKYKLPTLLRILQEDEWIPETSTGKVNRKMIGEKYFPLSVDGPLPPDVEFWDGKGEDEEVDFPRKAWDWGGM